MDISRFSKLHEQLRAATRFLWNVCAIKNGKEKIQCGLNVLKVQAGDKLWILDAQEHLKKETKFEQVQKEFGLVKSMTSSDAREDFKIRICTLKQ